MAGSKIITLGCRLNTLESEIMRNELAQGGIDDAIIINTCAVTAEAERQARQTIRKCRRDRPDARIIVTGCAAQLDPAKFANMIEVDRVVGNHEKLNIDTLVGAENAPDIHVTDIQQIKETAAHLIQGIEGRTRAFLLVQQGCDNDCTFCIIPAARGRNRAVPLAQITEQAKTLVKTGHQEVVLTGVDIAAYGADQGLCDENGTGLTAAIRALLKATPNLARLRLSSLDPARLDDEFFALLGDEPRLMPHLHLSLQAADDMILTRMKRRHRIKDIEKLMARTKDKRPDVVFGADLIAGFPTESDGMFQNTFTNVKAWGLEYLHVFPYSKRPNTPAERMPQVSGGLVKKRAKALRELGNVNLTAHLLKLVDTRQNVLVETKGFGRTETFAPVKLDPSIPAGSLETMVMTAQSNGQLHGALNMKAAQ